MRKHNDYVDNNRLHVNIKTTNILVLSYYELIVVFIF